jgi:hypothetical protein
MSNDKSVDQLERLQGMQYGQEAMKWYGWGSPIGLSVFLVAMAAIVIACKLAFWS